MVIHPYDPLLPLPLTITQLPNPKSLFPNLVKKRGCAVWTQEVGGYSLHSQIRLILNDDLRGELNYLVSALIRQIFVLHTSFKGWMQLTQPKYVGYDMDNTGQGCIQGDPNRMLQNKLLIHQARNYHVY